MATIENTMNKEEILLDVELLQRGIEVCGSKELFEEYLDNFLLEGACSKQQLLAA